MQLLHTSEDATVVGDGDEAAGPTGQLEPLAWPPRKQCLVRVVWGCQRGCKPTSSQPLEGKKTKRTKKVGCPFLLIGWIQYDNPGVMHFKEVFGHRNHIPGDEEDCKWLSIDPSLEKRIQDVRFG